jgi:hypothetical protein
MATVLLERAAGKAGPASLGMKAGRGHSAEKQLRNRGLLNLSMSISHTCTCRETQVNTKLCGQRAKEQVWSY